MMGQEIRNKLTDYLQPAKKFLPPVTTAKSGERQP
jgi:hypothetical protein